MMKNVIGKNWPVITLGVVLLAVLSEFAGLLGAVTGNERSYAGPMGKSDRALVFGMVGLLIGCGMPVAAFVNWIWAAMLMLLILTVTNRVRSAVATRHPGNRR